MPADAPLDSALGRVLRDSRRSADLTLAQLAERAGISQPHLSQMENGKASPSIATLYRLAGALGVAPQDLLPPSDVSELLVTRRGEGSTRPMSEAPGAATVRVLIGAPGRELHADEVTAAPGADLGGWFDHGGEELLHVLDGAIALEVEGHDAVTLRAGDTAWFDSDRPHRWTTAHDAPTRILVVNAATARTHSF